GQVDNTATADSDEFGPTTDDESVALTQAPSMVLTKTGVLDNAVVAPAEASNPGDTITYTFSIENTGNVTLNNLVVTDPLLPTLTCSIATLAPSATQACAAANNVYTLVQADIDAGQVDNTATADSDEFGPATDDESIALVLEVDLGVTKDDGVTEYIPGGSLTYTIVISNAGANDAVDATFADNRPADISSWSWTCAATGTADCGATASGTGSISVSDIDLPTDGASNYLTYTIDATVSGTANDPITNTATVTAPVGTFDTDTSNNTASDTDTRANDPPSADANGPYAIAEGDSVDLDASASSDPNGDPLTFAWDLDNDSVYGDVTGETPTVDWATLVSFGIDDDGTYPISVEVDDGFGGTDTAASTIVVSNTPPTLLTTGAATAEQGLVYTLNLSAIDPGDDTITSWTINWGDGSIETFAGDPASVTHIYDNVGFTNNILASAIDEDATYLQNDLVVASANNDRINWYTHDWTTNIAAVRPPGQSGPDAGLLYPADPTIGPDGNVYIAGWDSGNVTRYDPTTGAFIDEFASGGTEAAGLAFGPDGNLYVADFVTSEVLRYDGTTGAFIDAFVTAGSGGLDYADGLTFGPDGNLYVGDYWNHNILRFDGTTGAFIDVFVPAFSGGLMQPEDIAFGPDGNLYVASDWNDNVLRYNGTTGAFIDEFVASHSGGLDNPMGVVFGPDGNLYVSSWQDDNVLRFNGTTGAFIDEYVTSGLGGLDVADYHDFIPGHQVLITPGTVADANGPYAIAEGESVVLDGSGSSDPQGDPLTYAWDLNNDSVYGDVTGETPTVDWATLVSFGIDDDGTYPIGLEVDDGNGHTDTDASTIVVSNTPPTLLTTGDPKANAGQIYTLNLSAIDPGDDTITSWTINWGDGSIETFVGDPASVTHIYSNEGFTYNILASAIDEDAIYFQNELVVASGDDGRLNWYIHDWITNIAAVRAPGQSGPDAGLSYPTDAVVGPDGSVYVSGWTSNNVVRYDAATGAFIDEFIPVGSGGLDGSSGMAFGPDGNLYVSSYWTQEVLRYNGTTGAFIDVFVTAGLGGLDLVDGLIFGPDGNLYVSDSNAGVYRYDGNTGAFIDAFVPAGSGGLDNPNDLTFGPDGNLYIASNTNNNVLRFNGLTGAFIDEFVAPGNGLVEAEGIAFGPDGNFYVSSNVENTVKRYNGTTGIYIDDYVTTGLGGLIGTEYFNFIPEHQIFVQRSPTADANGPYAIAEGDSVDLDASASSDPDGDPMTYAWDLNNDAVYGDVTGETPTVDWATLASFGIDDDGTYPISVEVDDGFGGTDTAASTIVVSNTPPTLLTTGAATADQGQVYTLNLSAVDPGDDTITSWTINWGDGSIETFVGDPASVTHTYTNPGFTFNILASAIDEDAAYMQNDLVVASANNNMINWYTHDWTTNLGAVRPPGQSGPDAGLLYPADPTIGPDGNVYIAGWDSGNVTRYDPTTGAFIDEFATGGTEAAGITFGPDGNLYVADFVTHEVLRYDGTTGAFIDAFVTAGSGGLDQADGITFGPDDNLYVGDYRNDNVLRFDGTTGAFIDEFVTSGSGGLNTPEDLAFGPDGNLYVAADDNHTVMRFDGTTGAFIDIFVAAHSGGMDNPMGVVFGPDGNLYVSSWANHNVLRYDGTTGAFIDEYVTSGLGGLDIADYHDFIPGHQVLVVAATTADANGPYAINVGDPVDLDASGSSDPEGDPLTYAWDLDNDSVYGDVTGETPTVDWATLVSFGIDSAGVYPIGVEVDDGNGHTDTDASTIVVTDAPSWDPIASVISYKASGLPGWNIDSDANAANIDDTDDGSTTSDSNLDTGGFANKLKLKDRGMDSNYLRIDTGIALGQSGTMTLRLHASDSKGPGAGCGGKAMWSDFTYIYLYAHDGDETVDPTSETILTKDVDYTVVSGPLSGEGCVTEYVDLDVSSLYSGASGTTNFILRVIGEVGGGLDVDENLEIKMMAEIYTDFSAVPLGTTADANGPYAIDEGDSVDLDASGSSDPEGDPLTYAWDLNNDSVYGDVTGETPTVDWATLVSFGIDDDGTYPIGLEVDDGNGHTDTDTSTIVVSNTAPTLLTTGAAMVDQGQVYTLNLSAVDPGDDTITSWTINWGDGTIEAFVGDPASVTHTYSSAGFTYNILASAIDEDATFFQNDLSVASYNNDRINWYTHDWVTNIAAVRSPGQSGPDAGLDYPLGLIIGPDGSVYVGGEVSNNVLRYDGTTGAFIDEFVLAGSGGLNDACGIAFGSDGNLYVASLLTSEVLRYDGSTGAFIDDFVTAGLGGLVNPNGLAFGPDANLYVSDWTNDAVYRYDGSTGAFIDIFVTAGLGGLEEADDLIFGPDGNLYVSSDSGNNVLRYNGTTGAFIDEFVPSGSGGLQDPTGLAFGPDGHLFVGSWSTDEVLRFDGTSGAFMDAYVTAGLGGLLETYGLGFLPGHQVLVSGATAADANGPYAINEGDSVLLDGSGSSDPEGDPLTYNWDLNNDSVYGDVTGETPTVDWATLVSFGIDDDGTYPIGLEVDDGNGHTDTDTSTIVVSNAAPTLLTTGAATASAGSPFTLNLSAVDPGDDTITSWIISWGDGTIETIVGNPASVTHTYNNLGFTNNILAYAVDEDASYFQNDLVVASSSNDRLNWYTHDWETDIAVVRAPGQSGPDAGLDYTVDPIVGPDGNVYVSGWLSSNVVRYDPTTGAYIDEFVAAGSGGLTMATGMAFGPDGNLYVADANNRNVLRYNGTTGAFIDEFVTAGLGGLDEAEGMTFGPDGNLYVSDYTSAAVFRYDGNTGAFIDVFVTSGSGGLANAEDLTFGPDGNLYVASDGGSRVLRYNGATGAFIDVFVTSGSGGLLYAMGVTFGPDGNLYVSSFGTDSVKRYNGTTGAYIDEYVTAGLGGLDNSYYSDFIPGHQVLIVP
ncbi:MAG TPA: DUF11 domain-containing protein, partial [Anaerolineae bacterium]|nr:DUF11 domain-containing protein [Anaerolineae bacterium]